MRKRLLSLALAAIMAAGLIAVNTVSAVAANEVVYLGFGSVTNFREGPGSDETGTPVYSFNYTFVAALFDAQGRIIMAETDILEVATPNYDGEGMPHFSGWPGMAGYNIFDHESNTIVAPGEPVNAESAAAEIDGWQTKRERGDGYGMSKTNDWHKQMDFFQEWFKGKTVSELRSWLDKNGTAAGRPIKLTTTNEAELEKLGKLGDDELAELADVLAGATMSLEDPHGLILTALENAFENRSAVANGAAIAALGLGCEVNFRNGPGSDLDGNPVYSANVTVSGVAFDENGGIVTTVTDILEIVTPNYDGTAPRFYGWPGTEPYFTYYLGTEEIVAAEEPVTVDEAREAIDSWQTKRERGDGYGMSDTNDWYKQMDFFQDWMAGQTISDLNSWFSKNTTASGRPIKDGTTNETDLAKLERLSDDERAALADVVAGATMSLEDSHGKILTAMYKAYKNSKALAGSTFVRSVPAATAAYMGFGSVTNFREGPGRDATETPVYSFNYTFAVALFDEDGKIVDVETDIFEISTPNYDGESMPHFTGWPGMAGYNSFDHEKAEIAAPVQVTAESAAAEIDAWQTKRERGAAYGMNAANEWDKQMDFFQEWFKGKTVAELRAWLDTNGTAAGRPIKATTTNEEDLAKLAALSEDELAALAEVVAGATMSLEDPHGLIISALERAFDNKVPVDGTQIAKLGLGNNKNFRNGPGSDGDGNPVYSANIVTSGVAFDTEGVVVATVTDILEIITPNYDGTTPRFYGWPGTLAYYTYDHETGQIIGSVTENASTHTVVAGDSMFKIATEHGITFDEIVALNPQIQNAGVINIGDIINVGTVANAAEPLSVDDARNAIETWETKRERGDRYGMSETNDWYRQMDFFQEWMTGKTVNELDEWFAKNTTAAGRPIKAETTNEADLAKLAALTEDELAVLAEVVAGATMSLEDPHGRILSAMKDAYNKARPLTGERSDAEALFDTQIVTPDTTADTTAEATAAATAAATGADETADTAAEATAAATGE